MNKLQEVDTPRSNPPTETHTALEAERAIVGGLMVLPDEWSAVAGNVSAEDFTDATCRRVFTAIEALNTAALASYYPAVATWLQDRAGAGSSPLGVDAVRALAERGGCTPAVIAQAVEIVRAKAIQRKVADCLASLSGAATRPDVDVAALMERARARFNELSNTTRELPQRVKSTHCLHPPKLDFVLPGLLVGAVGLIVGPGAIGKSMLAYQMGADVAVGAPIAARENGDGQLWAPQTVGPVAICFGEDRFAEIANRGRAVYASLTPEQVARADGPQGLFVRSTVGMDMRVICAKGGSWVPGPFLATVRRIAKGKRLLMLDPLAFLHDANENDNGAMTYLMHALARVADETNCAILVLHHVGKPGSEERDEAYAARGASSLTTAARVQYSLRKLTDKEAGAAGIELDRRDFWMRLAVTKANYIPPQQPGLLRRLAGGLLAFGGLQEAPKSKSKGSAKAAEGAEDEEW